MAETSRNIITENLDAHFRALTSGKTERELIQEIQKRIANGTIVRAQSTRIVEPFFIPYIQRTEFEIPKDRKTLNKFKRYFYYNEPIVSAACELHAEFPLSTFDVTHEDASLAKEFQGIAEDLDLFEFLLNMLLEYWVIGEAFPFGFFDSGSDPRVWTKFILINPDYVHIQRLPLSSGKYDYKILIEPDEAIKQIVNNGPTHPETGDLYEKLPSVIIEAVRAGRKIEVSPYQIYHFKRPGDYFSLRGVSIIERCFKWLFYRDKLREAQYAIADRHVSPKEFYLIGTDQYPATQEEICQFRDLLISMYHQPNQAIVWNHRLHIQWEGAAGRILPLQPEFQYIDKQLAIALLINEGIITAERQPYASTSVALDVMIQRYLALRSRVENFLRKFVFGTICRLNGIYKPMQFELQYRIRIMSPDKQLWLPDIKWTKGSLRDDISKLQFIASLVEKDLLPPDYIYNLLDFTKEEVLKKLDEWHRRKEGKTEPSEIVFPAEAPPSEIPGEVPPEEAGPEAETEEEGLPEIIEEESRAVPPESHEEMELPTGI